MAKKKKKRNSLLALGLTSGVGAFAVAGLPSNASTTPIKQNITGGFAKFSTAFPVAFRLKGTALVLRSSSKLIKTTSRLKKRKMKGGRKRR